MLASGVILAGGASRRMGRDKAWVELGGRALVQRVMDSLSTVCQEIVVVANTQEPYRQFDVQLTQDIIPGKGSLGGIYSGLHLARYDRAIVVACDMPFLNPALLGYMLTLADEYDVVIPSARDESKPKEWTTRRLTAKNSDLHPLHAVYSKNCLDPIAARLKTDDLRLIGFYPDVQVRIVSTVEVEQFDPKHLSLFNANTPEQLTLAEKLLAEHT